MCDQGKTQLNDALFHNSYDIPINFNGAIYKLYVFIDLIQVYKLLNPLVLCALYL